MTLITAIKVSSGKWDDLNPVNHVTFPSESFRYADHRQVGVEVVCDTFSFMTTSEGWARILPLLTDTPAPDAAVASNPDTLEFSRLMYTWYKAKCVLDEARRSRLAHDAIQAEKEAYFAIVEYIKHAPPALPSDVIDAYYRWQGDFLDSRAMNGMIARIQDHLPSRKQESEFHE